MCWTPRARTSLCRLIGSVTEHRTQARSVTWSFHVLLCLCRRNGRFTGFPVLGIKWQRMESAGLRSAYALEPPRKGVLVRSIWPTSPVSKEVRPDDIIMRFDGVDIACDGTVPFRCDYMCCYGPSMHALHNEDQTRRVLCLLATALCLKYKHCVLSDS